MKYIIRFSPEIIIKSRSVRKKSIRMLQKNIRHIFKYHSIDAELGGNWDILTINVADIQSQSVKSLLKDIPGVGIFMEVEEMLIDPQLKKGEFFDLMDEKILLYHKEKVAGKKFVVRIKRVGHKHDFSSPELEASMGGYLLNNSNAAGVDLHNPEYVVMCEIKDNSVFFIKDKIEGICGYPIGFQEKVLSLISGGFDSGVSTYSMMKRGCQVDYLFFNLGGRAHELGVKQVSYYLWKKFSIPYKSACFLTIDFSELMQELAEKVRPSLRGILLKRYMLRLSSKICEQYYFALVKGDSLGQVSSQTLTNMNIIDKASDSLVLRPLISSNKQEIIDISQEIGTYDFACNMPEYCGAISDKASASSSMAEILAEEAKVDPEVIIRALESKQLERVSKMLETEDFLKEEGSIETTKLRDDTLILIDIREADKIKRTPFKSDLAIPFFRLNSEFPKLDQTKTYGFYCDKGVLSQLHGLYLKELGFENIVVYRGE